MRRVLGRVARHAGRSLLLLLGVVLGTVALMRLAPGYFADANELDPQRGSYAREHLQSESRTEGSTIGLTLRILERAVHGDLGQSRQYEVPVTELIRPRVAVTARLLAVGIGLGALIPLLLAVPLSARRGRAVMAMIAVPTALLLAIPTGAMATMSQLANVGGPATVLAVLVGSRNFKFLYGLLRGAWDAPHLVYARAQGISPIRLIKSHLLPVVASQLLALFTMSIVVALGAIVPVEVIFNQAGLGALAWGAAMNRDLPVLLAVTLMMASVVACVGIAGESAQRAEILL